MQNQVVYSPIKFKIIHVFQMILCLEMLQYILSSIKPVHASSCQASNCQSCVTNSPFCSTCNSPFLVNSFGYCDASSVCNQNEFYSTQKKSCVVSCQDDLTPNPVLNVCDDVSICSSTKYFGSNQLPPLVNQPVYFDSTLGLYIFPSVSNTINIYDTSSLQYMAQITTQMATIGNCVYDSTTQNIVVSNTQGEIEIWNVLSTDLIFSTKVQVLDNSYVQYVEGLQKFFYIDKNRYLSVIDDFSKGPQTLLYQLVNISFKVVICNSNKSITFGGTQLEILQISMIDYSQIYYNAYNYQLPNGSTSIYNIMILNNEALLFYRVLPAIPVYGFDPNTSYLLNTTKLSTANGVGYSFGTYYQKPNLTAKVIQFYQVDKSLADLVAIGIEFPLTQNKYVSSSDKSYGFGYSVSSTIKQVNTHIKFKLNLTSEAMFTDKMITNIVSFNSSVVNFLLLDEVNNRVVTRDPEGNIQVMDTNTLKTIYFIKQFQQAPLTSSEGLSLIQIRPDLNQPNIIISTINSLQNINLINNKKRFKSDFGLTAFNQMQATQNVLITQQGTVSSFQLYKLSNMQRLNTVVPSTTLSESVSKCPNPYFFINTPATKDDFISLCKRRMIYWQYSPTTQTYNNLSNTIFTTSAVFIVKEMIDHIIICYVLNCNAYVKTNFQATAITISNLAGNIFALNTRNDQTFFTVLANSTPNTVLFFSYPSFTQLAIAQLPSGNCTQLIGSGYFENNKAVFACRTDLVSVQTNFYVFSLTITPTPSVSVQTYVLPRLVSNLFIFDSSTVFTFYTSGVYLYFYQYAFATSLIEKAASMMQYAYLFPNPYVDTALRRFFFTFNNQVYSSGQFIGEYQIWSISYNNRYYDILDDGNTNQIQKVKQCIVNSYMMGILRSQYIYVSDNMRNLEYKNTIQTATDFLLDSSISMVFYISGTKVITALNYITKDTLSFTQVSNMNIFQTFTSPMFEKTVVAYNNVNMNVTLCKYSSTTFNCFALPLSASTTTYIVNITCYQNVGLAYDSIGTYYYLTFDPTSEKQPITISQQSSANRATLITKFGLLIIQNTGLTSGIISNTNGLTVSRIIYKCFVQDIISYNTGYIIVCPKSIYCVSSAYVDLTSFSTVMQIQKVSYYASKNLLLILSNQQGYSNYLSVYDMGSQLQLQSIQLGNYPLQDILYFQEEDIYVVYNLYGQIYRMDFNLQSQQDYVVNVLEADTGSQTANYFPGIFYSRRINKLFFANQNSLHKWNYSPFIGQRLNFRFVRYLHYYVALNKVTPSIIYYSDLQSFVWQFQNDKQFLIQQMPNEVQDMYTTPTYLVIFSLQNIFVFQISDSSSTLLINNSFSSTTIQFSMQLKTSMFAYITSDYDFFMYDLSTNQYQIPPIKIATLPAQILDFILISEDTVLIALLNQSPVLYKAGNTQFTTLLGVSNVQTFIGFKLINSLSAFIIIEMRSIISLSSQTLTLIKQITFPEYDSAGYIESFAFDDQLNQLFFHYQFHSYVSIIPYSLDKSLLTFIGSPDIYRVKFLIQTNYIAIYCTFQINFHSRDTNLNYLYSFRMPTSVSSMTSLSILNDSYLVITQRAQINIYLINQNQGSTPTFTLFQTVYSSQSTIISAYLDDDGNIKLSGVGLEGYFNNVIVVGFQCKQTLTSIKNKLALKSQLNYVSIATENVQKYYYFNIQLDSQTTYAQLPFVNDLAFTKNNGIIQYISQQTDQQLTLNNNIFLAIKTVDLILSNFKLVIPNETNNIQFSPTTQKVIIRQISINQDLNKVVFNFSNLERVVIDQLTITDLTITDSVLFKFVNVKEITISNINLINVNLIRSQLIYIINSNKITLINLQMQSIRVYQYVGKMMINICSSQQLDFLNFFFSDITGTNVATSQDISTATQLIERDLDYLQQQVNNIIYIQKVQKINLNTGSCQLLKQIQLIKIEDFYNDGSLLQTLVTSYVTLNTINFKTNQGMFSQVSIKASNVTLSFINAQQNSCSDCNGAVFFIYKTSYFNLSNSIFDTNIAIHGGSLSIHQCQDVYNYFKNNQFIRNQAKGYGGAVYLDSCDLNDDSTSYQHNSAVIGGAIKYLNIIPIFINGIGDILNTITFTNNTAQIYGNNYGSYFSSIKIINLPNSKLNSTFIKSNDTFQTFAVSNFQSGNDIIFYLQIFDEEQEAIKYDPQSLTSSKTIPTTIKQLFQKIIFNLVSEQDQILIEGSTFATYQNFDKSKQMFIFQQAQLIAQPQKLGTLYIQTNSDFEVPDYLIDRYTQEAELSSNGRLLQSSKKMSQTITSNTFIIQINVSFRDCQVGEIYQNISTTKTSCYVCPTGSYSLATPNYYEKQTCNSCSDYDTQQCGNNTIILKDGFWRKNATSDVIVKCLNKPENCVDDSNSRNYCKLGLIGPLCETCDVLGEIWGQPYSQTLEFQCAPCTDFFSTYVRWVLLFLGVNIYIVGTMWIFFGIYRNKAIVYYLRLSNIIAFGNSARRDQSSTYLKFLITYASLQSNINQFKYDVFVLSIPSMFGQPVSQLNTATDCQIVSYQNKLLVKTAAMLCLPILFYLWICLIYLFKSIFEKRGIDYWAISRMKLFTLFLFSFTVFQPNIVSFLIQSLSCRVIGDEKYVTSDITMICYNTEHIYVILIAIFGILLWVIIVPFYILMKLKQIKHPEWITKQYCYGFLYIEFNKKNKYWELVRLQLKLLVVLFVNLLQLNPVTQFSCLSATLFIYYHLIHKFMPYETLHMNQIDKIMIISIAIQLVLNAIIKDTSINSGLNTAIILTCMVINIVTFCYLILIILLQKIQFVRQNIIKFKYMLQQIPCLKNASFLQVELEVETSFRRFKLWKILSQNWQAAIVNCQIVKYKQLRENFLQKSQNLKANRSKNSENQQNRESNGYETMIKELANSSFPTVQIKQNQKQNTYTKYVPNVEQLNITLDGEQTQSPKYTGQGLQNKIGEDKVNSDFLNSVLGKDSKYVGQNSIPYNHAQNRNLKISVSHSNSPLQNSNNSLTAQQIQQTQQTFALDKASPFKTLHNNGIIGKNPYHNNNKNANNNADINQIEGENIIMPSNSGISLNHIASTAAISNNLIGNSSATSQNQLLSKPKFNQRNQDLDDYKSPPSLSYNASVLAYQENDEDESKIKFETVGLKQFNSQINPKIISDEQLVNPPNGPRKMSSSSSGSEKMDDEDEGVSGKISVQDSGQFDKYKVQESPISNLVSQLDRYQYQPDYLMKMSKRSLIQNKNADNNSN